MFAAISSLPAPVLGVVIFVLLVIFFGPIKKFVKFILHVVLGFLMLFLVNSVGAGFGLYLPVSLLNCLISGLLGIPGVLLLLAWNFFM